MSQDSQDIGAPVRRVWTAFSARDWAAFAAELDPEVEYSPVEEQTVYRGPEACTEYAQRWLDVWDAFSTEVEETESAPTPNRVFARMRFRGRGRPSCGRRPRLHDRRSEWKVGAGETTSPPRSTASRPARSTAPLSTRPPTLR